MENLKEKKFSNLRQKVAKETALLLYTEQRKEYKQAKKQATETLGARIMPTNREVADELDKLAEEIEGDAKRERLVQMRKEALKIMQALEKFKPRLIGSVWRGTANKNSDIDILLHHSGLDQIIHVLQENAFNITHTKRQTTTKQGIRKTSFHIYLTLQSDHTAEIVIKDTEKKDASEKCEIYLDEITGLTLENLKQVLENYPTQTFIPKRSYIKGMILDKL